MDARPLCPRCGYDLRGLPVQRCPECGRPFEWEEVVPGPGLACEEATSVRAAPAAFCTTCLLALLRPGRFARRACAGVRLLRGAAFGLACFAFTALALWVGAEWSLMLAWWTTAAIYILAQALVLALLDRNSWTPARAAWRRSFAFWLAIGGYTSAVVVTEFLYGPPLIGLSSLLDVLQYVRFPRPIGFVEVLQVLQVAIWATGVASVFTARVAGRRRAWYRRPLGVAIWCLLWCLYGACVEFVGVPLFHWYAGALVFDFYP